MFARLAYWLDAYLKGTVEIGFNLFGLLDNWHPVAAIALIVGSIVGATLVLPHWMMIGLVVLLGFPFVVFVLELIAVTVYLEAHSSRR